MKTKEKLVRSDGNVFKVDCLYKNEPSTSQRKAAQQLNISRSSLQRIMSTDIDLFPYKIQVYQPISPNASIKRLEFANRMITMKESGEIDFGKIWFSDECHFQLEGYVNKQNYRFWGTENPHVQIIKPLHPKRVTVWCAMSSTSIIGPVFLTENVTGERYCQMLNENVFPYIVGTGDLEDYWFMQDGARPHRTNDVFNLLSEYFGNRLIGLDSKKYTGEGLDWPPYSPDINPCDFSLWGTLKDNIYKTPVIDIEELKVRIEHQIKVISRNTLENCIKSFESRLRHIIATEGKHFENLLY